MRADRLVAIVLLLQTRGMLTVADLAQRLEVSERTIRRDLEGLSGAGVPVYAQRGRGGGWTLLGGHRIDLSGLTADEAQALFLVAGPNALAGVGVEPGVKSALRKLLAALPAPFREQAEAAGQAVLVDPDRWGRPRERGRDQPEHLPVLRDAVLRGRQVELRYAKPGLEAEARRVHPYGLVSKSGTWYLLAGASSGLRTFKVSRVQAVVITDQPVERPDDFDLAEAWESAQSGFSGRTWVGGTTVRMAVEPASVRFVAALLGRWANLQPLPQSRSDRGWPHYAATFPNADMAAAELVRFGSGVEVESPAEVRVVLAARGRDLVATYGATPAARPARR